MAEMLPSGANKLGRRGDEDAERWVSVFLFWKLVRKWGRRVSFHKDIAFKVENTWVFILIRLGYVLCGFHAHNENAGPIAKTFLRISRHQWQSIKSVWGFFWEQDPVWLHRLHIRNLVLIPRGKEPREKRGCNYIRAWSKWERGNLESRWRQILEQRKSGHFLRGQMESGQEWVLEVHVC